MPVIKSAIKKQRKDKKREKENSTFMVTVAKAVKAAQKGATPKVVAEAFSMIDRAAKKNLLHKNKAARMKAGLSKLLPQKKAPIKEPTAKTPNTKKK